MRGYDSVGQNTLHYLVWVQNDQIWNRQGSGQWNTNTLPCNSRFSTFVYFCQPTAVSLIPRPSVRSIEGLGMRLSSRPWAIQANDIDMHTPQEQQSLLYNRVSWATHSRLWVAWRNQSRQSSGIQAARTAESIGCWRVWGLGEPLPADEESEL